MTCIQFYNKTNIDLRYPALGDNFKIQSWIKDIQPELEVPTVREVIADYSKKCLQKLENHPHAFLDNSKQVRRLKQTMPLDLPYINVI